MTTLPPLPERTDTDDCSCGDESSVFINPLYAQAIEAEHRTLREVIARSVEAVANGQMTAHDALVGWLEPALELTHDIPDEPFLTVSGKP